MRLLTTGKLLSEAGLFHGKRGFALSASALQLNHKCQVLVVGGGSGGCSVAAKMSNKLGEGKVIIVEPADKHYYQPMFTLIGGGMKKLEDSYYPMESVLPSLAKWLKDSVVEFDPDRNQVKTRNGDTIEYEQLLVATGLELKYDKIPGAVEALSVPGGNVCSNYSPDYVGRTYEALEKFQSGNAIFTYPNSPVKCPGAPQKIMYIAEHYFRRTKKRMNAKIIYNTSLPVIFGVKHYADALWKVVEKRNITVNLRNNLIQVIPEKNVAVFENLDTGLQTTTEYSFLHITPPMGTPQSLATSKLVLETGFVDVNKDTMQHNKYRNVFAIGDCSASPNSKTAASAAAQSPVVYNNMLSVMAGQKPHRTYDGYASCPLVTGYHTCILAEFDYNLQPLETFPIAQNKERYTMFLMKKMIMPPLYWQLMMSGLWNGPAFLRKMLSVFKPYLTKF